jgi:hypothetical protein
MNESKEEKSSSSPMISDDLNEEESMPVIGSQPNENVSENVSENNLETDTTSEMPEESQNLEENMEPQENTYEKEGEEEETEEMKEGEQMEGDQEEQMYGDQEEKMEGDQEEKMEGDQEEKMEGEKEESISSETKTQNVLKKASNFRQRLTKTKRKMASLDDSQKEKITNEIVNEFVNILKLYKHKITRKKYIRKLNGLRTTFNQSLNKLNGTTRQRRRKSKKQQMENYSEQPTM